jgi:hypothetical protein
MHHIKHLVEMVAWLFGMTREEVENLDHEEFCALTDYLFGR